MNTVFTVLPDFLIIFLGALLARWFTLPEGFWKGVEKLVYFVLFPPLLFHSVAASHFSLKSASLFLIAGIVMMLCAVVVSYFVSYKTEMDEPSQASAFQCNFRFNSYIGFALTLNLYGTDGFALLALFTAFWVPISSTIAVTMLAKAKAGKGTTVKAVALEVIKNPLIIATVAGLFYNFAGFGIAKPLALVLTRLGSASLALGLLAIGAALKFETVNAYRSVVTVSVVTRLLIVPVLCLITCHLLNVDALGTAVLLIFAALPTANSCYILAVRMGGNGPLVAAITTLQTLVSVATLTGWLLFAQIYLHL